VLFVVTSSAIADIATDTGTSWRSLEIVADLGLDNQHDDYYEKQETGLWDIGYWLAEMEELTRATIAENYIGAYSYAWQTSEVTATEAWGTGTIDHDVSQYSPSAMGGITFTSVQNKCRFDVFIETAGYYRLEATVSADRKKAIAGCHNGATLSLHDPTDAKMTELQVIGSGEKHIEEEVFYLDPHVFGSNYWSIQAEAFGGMDASAPPDDGLNYWNDAGYEFALTSVEGPAPEIPRTRAMCVGVKWPYADDLLRGDLDAHNMYEVLEGTFSNLEKGNVMAVHEEGDYSQDTNLQQFYDGFSETAEGISSGDVLILSFASHGDSLASGTEPAAMTHMTDGSTYMSTGDEYICLSGGAPSGARLYDDDLLNLLDDPVLDDVKKIVILDACRSGGFGLDLANNLPNIAVLAGCPEGGFTLSEPDGTGVFTNTIIAGLSAGPSGLPSADGDLDGIVTLDELSDYVSAYDFGDLIGQSLQLRNLDGEMVFDGLDMKTWTSSDFDDIIWTPEPASMALLAAGALVMLRKRR